MWIEIKKRIFKWELAMKSKNGRFVFSPWYYKRHIDALRMARSIAKQTGLEVRER